MLCRPLPLASTLLWGAVITATVSLVGCTARESRIETALIEAGASPGMAACLAPRLAKRLSDDQLRALGKATASKGEGHGPAAIVARVAATGDAETMRVVSKAVLHCALR